MFYLFVIIPHKKYQKNLIFENKWLFKFISKYLKFLRIIKFQVYWTPYFTILRFSFVLLSSKSFIFFPIFLSWILMILLFVFAQRLKNNQYCILFPKMWIFLLILKISFHKKVQEVEVLIWIFVKKVN